MGGELCWGSIVDAVSVAGEVELIAFLFFIVDFCLNRVMEIQTVCFSLSVLL